MSKLKIILKLIELFVSGRACGVAFIDFRAKTADEAPQVQFTTFTHVISHGHLLKMLSEGIRKARKK